MTFRACSSPAPTPVKPQPASAILSQESVHTTLSITHHTRKRPSTGPRTSHGPHSAQSDHISKVQKTPPESPLRRRLDLDGLSWATIGHSPYWSPAQVEIRKSLGSAPALPWGRTYPLDSSGVRWTPPPRRRRTPLARWYAGGNPWWRHSALMAARSTDILLGLRKMSRDHN
jgi:hypothetical protein